MSTILDQDLRIKGWTGLKPVPLNPKPAKVLKVTMTMNVMASSSDGVHPRA
jgi:hypothetical protein